MRTEQHRHLRTDEDDAATLARRLIVLNIVLRHHLVIYSQHLSCHLLSICANRHHGLLVLVVVLVQ